MPNHTFFLAEALLGWAPSPGGRRPRRRHRDLRGHLGQPLHQGRPERGARRLRPQAPLHGPGRHACRSAASGCVKGGGTFVIPVIEKVDSLSLELLTIDVQQEQDVYTSKGVPVRVDGVAQIKVKGDDISIATAAEQFLSKDTEAIKNIAMQTLEGHLRAILGTMTVEDIYQNRDAFASEGPGSGRRRHGEHGPGHRQLHHPGHQGQPGLPRRAWASRASPRSSATRRSPRPRPTATR